MLTYAISIKPLSPFGTPLKGDTIFGQFCWQAAENPGTLNQGLDHWIARYGERPFAVFSSAWLKVVDNRKTTYAIRRPELPLAWLGEPDTTNCKDRLLERKKNKGRNWLLLGEDLQINPAWNHLVNDQEIFKRFVSTLNKDEQRRLQRTPPKFQRPVSVANQQHNTINRCTMTTAKGAFAPYSKENIHYLPGIELVVFAALDNEASDINRVKEAFTRMGQWGFGRDASTGLGRFELGEVKELTWPVNDKADACLSLGPCVPESNAYRELYFTPFTRFGRHGAQLNHAGMPFKNPIVMADEGAVFVPQSGGFPEKPYIGRAVQNVSQIQPEAVAQGYALYLPMTLPS